MRPGLDAGTYVPALDGLRGVAVLLVVLFHTLTPPFKSGFIGVEVFFVLSGYLICDLLLREQERTGCISLFRFYMRRFLRLMPALWTLLIAVLALIFWEFDKDVFSKARSEALWALLYVSNWVRALGHAEDMHFFAHTWSLGIEEQFYLLWPVALYFCVVRGGARRVLYMALVLACACWLWRCALLLQGASADRLYNGLDTRLDALMWGCALAAWVRGRSAPLTERQQRVLCLLEPAAAAALILLGCCLDWRSAYFHSVASTGVTWVAALLVFGAVRNPRSLLRPLLCWRPLVFLGTISYGLYLWHWSLEMLLLQQDVDISQLRVFTWVLAPFLAWLSFVLVERPFLRLKARFAPEC